MGNSPSVNSKSPTSASNASSRKEPRNLFSTQKNPADPSHSEVRRSSIATYRTRSSSQAATYLSQPTADSSQVDGGHGRIVPTGLRREPKSIIVIEEPSQPVDVPVIAPNVDNIAFRNPLQNVEPPELTALPEMSYHLTRPPRLPLPIEEEVHIPGSPIISPTDLETPVLDTENLENETLQRQISALSNSTVDEEDAEELRVDKAKATVPITFEWAHGGEKIYVTGTIFQWNRKHCLRPVAESPGLFRAVINIRPGTHHIRFIKDTVMLCSPDLPTTVDFGNNLVNYIEVTADDVSEDGKPMEPINAIQQSRVQAHVDSGHGLNQSRNIGNANVEAGKPLPKSRLIIPQNRYTSNIPQYIVDIDKPEDSVEYRNALAAVEKLPVPPSLPGFLGKPILNAATPLKDDNSVLIMPNHTVLNHLATSSIKNDVLAVSVTTRYKRKYVTTIMYKPTSH